MKHSFLYLIFILALTIFQHSAHAQDSSHQKDIFKNLIDNGVTSGLTEALEGYNNFHGGIKTGTAYASTFDANVNFDLEKLIGLKGASFYADFEYHSGDNPTQKLTGDFQVFDKHNSFPFAQMLELWYQQQLFSNKLRIKIGKIDANTEFSVIDNGLEFINSSTQVTPTLIVFPTFPDPVPAINIFFNPDKLFYTNLAIDDANQKAKFLNFYGDPVSVQPTTNGILILSESGLTWNHLFGIEKDGNLKLGLWTHTGTFQDFKELPQQSTHGLYVIFNQTLWQPDFTNNPARGIRMFVECAFTDSTVAPIYAHYGAGMVWQGMWPARPNDAVGITAHYTPLSPGIQSPVRAETNIETFYKLNINNWVSLKTDWQYIVHPGGIYRNAVVGMMVLNFALGT